MCAIVDTNVAGEVFGNSPSEAGRFFFNWLNSKGVLVIGGRLLQELDGYGRFHEWFLQASLAGRARLIPDAVVDAEAEALRGQGICRSNDEHILGLARVSGARLLFTNDQDLQDDFRDRRIIGGSRGRVYTTRQSRNLSSTHRSLLGRTNLCSA